MGFHGLVQGQLYFFTYHLKGYIKVIIGSRGSMLKRKRVENHIKLLYLISKYVNIKLTRK
jgi:hypothetical protein